jgi:hypothetical protein
VCRRVRPAAVCYAPATASAPSSSRNKACWGSLPDQIALKLSQSSKQVEDQLAATCCGIQSLLQASEVHSPAQASPELSR